MQVQDIFGKSEITPFEAGYLATSARAVLRWESSRGTKFFGVIIQPKGEDGSVGDCYARVYERSNAGENYTTNPVMGGHRKTGSYTGCLLGLLSVQEDTL